MTLAQRSIAASLAIMLLALPVAGNAQETTASIRGKILDSAGSPVGSAGIVVEDLRSGVVRTYATNDNGLFLATRLLPGGPYRVTVSGTQSVEVPSISVGDIYNLTVNLQTEAVMEEIIAIGQAADLVEVAAGPSATFTIDDLENAVSFSRDISDVYGIDPRLMIDSDEDGFGVNCAGKHPRFNNVTLDGVSQTDRFGLNENGYSTAVGMPFPYDAIEQIAVELAPFDVTYGGFSACNINSVTKSGTNEWEAKAFYEYSSNSYRGDRVADDPVDYSRPSYDKTYYGLMSADRLSGTSCSSSAPTRNRTNHVSSREATRAPATAKSATGSASPITTALSPLPQTQISTITIRVDSQAMEHRKPKSTWFESTGISTTITMRR